MHKMLSYVNNTLFLGGIMPNIDDFVMTGTPLDSLLDAILLDTGLNDPNNTEISNQDIIDGTYWASVMNGILNQAIVATGVGNDDHISGDDILAINQYIRNDPALLAQWTEAHGGDHTAGGPSGFGGTIHEEGGLDTFNRLSLVNRVLDSFYHIGFEIVDGRVTNEEGYLEYSVDLVAELLNDILYGAPITVGTEGDDTFVATQAAEVFWGGTGYDIVDYSTSLSGIYIDASRQGVEGLPSTGSTAAGDQFEGIDEIIGSNFDDRIGGSPQAEKILAGDGNDIVNGYWGDDVIYGGDGDDNLRGDRGNDEVYGEAGDDVILSFIDGNLIDGGIGNDTVIYEPWMEQTLDVDLEIGFTQGGMGAACHDILVSIENVTANNASNNTLLGSSGNNIIRGGAAEDYIDGRAGDDVLKGNEGNDTIIGGEGNDILEGYTGDDILEGGTGNDTLNGGAGLDSVSAGDGNDTVIAFLDGDTLSGGSGIDWINLDASVTQAVTLDLEASTLTGSNGGTDIISGFERARTTAQNDTVYGTDGDNIIYGEAGDDTLTGRAGNDVLKGGVGNDTLIGGEGIDTLEGYHGDDILIGGAGYDNLHGGDGNDTAVFSGLVADYTITEITGGFRLVDNRSGVTDGTNDVVAVENFQFGDGSIIAASDLLATQQTESGLVEIIGTDANDAIYGSDDDELIEGLGGTDSLRGNAGNDTILGGDDTDYIYGGSGENTVDAGEGHDYIYTFAAGDTIDGGNGIDWLRLEGPSGTIDFDLETGVLTTSNGANNSAVSIERVSATDGNDAIHGNASDNLFYGNNGDDFLDGRSGNDILKGGYGNDTMIGGAGNDTLEGYVGDDVLVGGTGVNYLHGGAGDDIFIFSSEEGSTTDIIQDFTSGAGSEDTIAIDTSLAADFDELMDFAQQSGSRTIIQFDATAKIYIDNTNVSDLQADDFLFTDIDLLI